MKLRWELHFKKDQHLKVLKKLCRKLKVEPVNTTFDLSGHPGKRSLAAFDVELKSTSWKDAVAESLEIGARISPHWHLAMDPPKFIRCTTDQCGIDGIEILGWHLHLEQIAPD